MSLAITLLTAVAVSSVIGSILQQDQTWPDYLTEFGPFWFEVFRALGLYEVYSAPWFVALLLFLVASTGVCILRRTPDVLREVTAYRLQRPATMLRSMPGAREGVCAGNRDTAAVLTRGLLKERGYRTRQRATPEATVVSGMRGQWGRLGDILIHLGIVVLAVGALIDANLPLHVRAAIGVLEPQPEDAPLERFEQRAQLAPTLGAFQGQVTVPEGHHADVAYVPIRDGYVLQSLPFEIELLDFRVAYYPDGQPRLYESAVRLHGPGDAETETTLAVNEPVRHAGHTLYQSSFEDGGSRLALRLWPLSASHPPRALQGQVGGGSQVHVGEAAYVLEYQSLELRNTRPDIEAGEGEYRDAGPALQYRMQGDDGGAVEVRTYQEVQETGGEPVFLTGVRDRPEARFHYLEIPADAEGSPESFLRLLAAVHDVELRGTAAQRGVSAVLEQVGFHDPGLQATLADFTERLMVLWVREGEDAVEEQTAAWVQATSQDPRMRALLSEVVGGILGHGFDQLYAELADAEKVPSLSSGERREFVRRAASALADVAHYPPPVFIELRDFDMVQASGIQITRAPGQPLVAAGAIALVIGLILMLYVPRHRVWVHFAESQEGLCWLVATQASRGEPDATTVEVIAKEILSRWELDPRKE